MTSALASLILYAYLGVARHRNRLGRLSDNEVRRVMSAVDIAFACFLLTIMLSVVFMMFQSEGWAKAVVIVAGVVDIGGATTAIIFGIRSETIFRKQNREQ